MAKQEAYVRLCRECVWQVYYMIDLYDDGDRMDVAAYEKTRDDLMLNLSRVDELREEDDDELIAGMISINLNSENDYSDIDWASMQFANIRRLLAKLPRC